MTPRVFPARLESPSGLSVEVNANGSIRRIDHRDVILNLFLGNEIEGGPANVYLRLLGESIESVPLLGPRSPGVVVVDDHGLTVRGEWNDIGFDLSLTLVPSAPAWRWHGTLRNDSSAAALTAAGNAVAGALQRGGEAQRRDGSARSRRPGDQPGVGHGVPGAVGPGSVRRITPGGLCSCHQFRFYCLLAHQP